MPDDITSLRRNRTVTAGLRRMTVYARWVGLVLAVLLSGAGILRAITWATGSEVIGSGLDGAPQITLWDVDDPNFGGLSALLMAPDGRELIAASDRGHFFTADVHRTAGRIAAVTNAQGIRAYAWKGPERQTSFKRDIEALTRLHDGRLVQAFENYTRIQIITAPGAEPLSTHPWDRFEPFFSNEAFEAIATLPDGRLLAVMERRLGRGFVPGYVYDFDSWTGPYPVPVTRGYLVTGADVGPDGCLYVLERRYGVATGFQFQVRRLWQDGGLWAPTRPWQAEQLYRSAPAQLGNAEGLSVWRGQNGQLRLSIITDDGFWPNTPTRIIEVGLQDGHTCR